MIKKTLTILSIAGGLVTAGMYFAGGTTRNKPVETKPAADTRYELNMELADNGCQEYDIPEMDRRVETYMSKWQIKGASLAIMKNDSLVYAKGYGWADESRQKKMHPGNIMRMASVSKLVTAAGIMVLRDKGMLRLDDNVFGENGILSAKPYAKAIKDRNYDKITVEHLLRHQGGFYRDPVFSNNDVRVQMGLDHAPKFEDYARLVLSHRLSFMPGASQRYSNFGYMVLSEIIEEISGYPYEAFMQQEVLEPAGCYDMHIAGNYYEDRYSNEVRYYTHEGDGKYICEYNGSGNIVERCYGGNNITLLSGAGAWCGSTVEIARFVASIDGRPEIPDILSKESVNLMTEYFDKEKYSLGWNDTNPAKGWSRTGTLAGTSALVKYFPDGECWIMITNTSTWRGPSQSRYTNTLFEQCRELYSSRLPEKNLFTAQRDLTCGDDVL